MPSPVHKSVDRDASSIMGLRLLHQGGQRPARIGPESNWRRASAVPELLLTKKWSTVVDVEPRVSLREATTG
jgi:hypothetical protein